LQEVERKLQAQAEAREAAEEKAKHYAEAIAKYEEMAKPEAVFVEISGAPARTATCECCGKNNIQKDKLVKIDSGQSLCPDCFGEFRRRCRS